MVFGTSSKAHPRTRGAVARASGSISVEVVSLAGSGSIMAEVNGRVGKGLTLADIARMAGVSRSAASRALDTVNPTASASAQRVREIAAEHGYVPNAWAANLRLQRSGVIGVVVPRLTDTVMAMLYEALVRECNERRLQAVVMTTDDDPRTEIEAGRALVRQRVDGLILTTARTDGADPLVLELREKGVRYALALRTDGESPSAVGDDELGGYLAVSHLIEHGHRRIAYVGGPHYSSSTQGRQRGFRRALAEAGVAPAEELMFTSDFSMEAGAATGRRLLALAEPPTAVFTANDSLAVGLMAAVQRAGLVLPRDLSVVGYSNTPLASNLATPLTSVTIPFPEIARDAVDLVVDPATGPLLRVSVPSLVVRESVTTPLPLTNRDRSR
jgi:LacI family transcriptional regulator